MCTLRNVSYKVDVEIDRDVYLDAIKQSTKSHMGGGGSNENDDPDIISRNTNEDREAYGG